MGRFLRPFHARPTHEISDAAVRRLLVCPCHGPGEPKSFAALDLGKDAVAPELAYVTAKFAALAPFGKVATLLSELLPVSGAQNAGTVRNRTLRVGQEVVQQPSTGTAKDPWRSQPALSWLGWIAVTCAVGTGRSATLRWSRAR